MLSSPHTFQMLISKSHSPPHGLVFYLIQLSRQSINMRIQMVCWNLSAQEGGLTGQLGGKIPENIPICACVLFIRTVLKRSLKKTLAASDKVQPSKVNVEFVALLLQ